MISLFPYSKITGRFDSSGNPGNVIRIDSEMMEKISSSKDSPPLLFGCASKKFDLYPMKEFLSSLQSISKDYNLLSLIELCERYNGEGWDGVIIRVGRRSNF